jgi:hypothetical protein
MRSGFPILLVLFALGASTAAAEDIRFPKTFKPALIIHTPKGWTKTNLDTALAENMEIESPDQTMIITVGLPPTLGSTDKIAAKILQGTAKDKTKAKLAGLDAFVYRGETTNPDGLKLHLKLFVAPIDPQEAFTVTLITAMDDNDPRLAPANAVIAGMKLLPK